MFLTDPRRKPIWRYERVRELMSQRRPPNPKYDDKLVYRLRDYYLVKDRLESRGYSETELCHYLNDKFGSLFMADRIFANGRSDRTRFGMEAYILTGEELGSISERTGVDPAVIDIYEKLFFHVSDRLKARNYIASQVLGDAFMAGLVNRSAEVTAKYFAYFGGKVVLEMILDAMDSNLVSPKDDLDLVEWLDKNYKNRLRTQGVVGTTFLEPTNYNIRSILEGYQGILSLTNKENADAGAENIVGKAVDIFLSMGDVPIGNKADKLLDSQKTSYSNLEIVPRVSHKLALANGGNVSILEKVASDDWTSPSKRPLMSGDTDASDNKP